MKVTLVLQKLAGISGGAERVATELGHQLTQRGHVVSIATFEPGQGAPGYDVTGLALVDLFPKFLRSSLRHLKFDTRLDSSERAVSTRGNSALLARVKWSATHGLFARKLATWLRDNPQDVVVGFMPPAISAVSVAGKRLGSTRPRIIASTHSLPSEDFGPSARWDQNPVTRRTNLWALEVADTVTVLQPEFVDQLPEAARARSVVVPNAVTRLGPDRQQLRQPIILGVGRLTEMKRFELLIKAFAAISSEFPHWQVEIYGEGDEQQSLNSLVNSLELQDRVRIAGVTPKIAEIYDTAQILCHPSSFEGFGLSVAEAIIHGLHAVASRDCSGVNRLIEDGHSGLLVDEGADPIGAFAAGLKRLMQDPPTADSRDAAADRLAQRLSPPRVYDQWEQILYGQSN